MVGEALKRGSLKQTRERNMQQGCKMCEPKVCLTLHITQQLTNVYTCSINHMLWFASTLVFSLTCKHLELCQRPSGTQVPSSESMHGSSNQPALPLTCAAFKKPSSAIVLQVQSVGKHGEAHR